MISFPRDNNRITVIGGTSSSDGITPVLPWVDPTTHRLLVDFAGGTGTVTSVGLSSTNSTLTIGSTPVTTSGTITADLNLGHANTWTATQTFSNATYSALFTGGNVGIGTTGPNAKTEILATTEQLRLSYDSTHYSSFIVNSAGDLTLVGGTTAKLTATTFVGALTGTSDKTNALNSATTVVNVSSATAPTSGQVLTATSGTAATWQTPASFSYPGAGITVSTGSAWGTSLTAPSGAIVGTSDTQALTNKDLTGAGNTFPTNWLPIGGGTLTGSLTLVAGTTTVQPLKMVAGTNLTTPVAGVFEFDGTNLYFSV